jgi:hypothetical protein
VAEKKGSGKPQQPAPPSGGMKDVSFPFFIVRKSKNILDNLLNSKKILFLKDYLKLVHILEKDKVS